MTDDNTTPPQPPILSAEQICKRKTFCSIAEHSDDVPCEIAPRHDLPRSDFGAKAASGRRWP